MRAALLQAAVGTMLIGAGISRAAAAETHYLMSVDILANDGGVALHQQVKCPRYERCTNVFPYVLNGKNYTLYIKTDVTDDQRIYVVVGPSGLADPFDSHTDTKAFEPGNEWITELHGNVAVPLDPNKPRPQWDKRTTELQWRTVLKVRMKLDG
jgi:hypothetical protein